MDTTLTKEAIKARIRNEALRAACEYTGITYVPNRLTGFETERRFNAFFDGYQICAQKELEWTEEDEKIATFIRRVLGETPFTKYSESELTAACRWFSTKWSILAPLHGFKPTAEQIFALSDTVNFLKQSGREEDASVLKDLLYNLRQIR